MIRYLIGRLTLSDRDEDMGRMNYGVVNCDDEFESITDILEKISDSKINLVRIALRQLNNGHTLHKMGSLYYESDKYDVDSWCINSLPFDQYLDELGGKDIEIYIEDFNDNNEKENEK